MLDVCEDGMCKLPLFLITPSVPEIEGRGQARRQVDRLGVTPARTR